MPFATTAAQNAALDAVVSTFPDDGTYRLYSDTAATTELPADGGTAYSWAVADSSGAPVYFDILPQPQALDTYAPADHSLTDWAAAADGSVTTTAPVPLGDGFSPALYFRNDI